MIFLHKFAEPFKGPHNSDSGSPSAYMTIDKNLYIHLIASGDESAFRQFITSNAPSCYRYAWRILKRKELAEEAVCEVFVAVWENRKHLPEIENTGAWLHRLTLHKSVSLLRKESRWDVRKERITESELDIPDFYEEPDYDAETVSLLNRAIGDLPEKCRQVFYLARIEKMSYREISRIMGISVKTVSNHLTYAMKRLSETILGGVRLLLQYFLRYFRPAYMPSCCNS